MTRVYNNRGHMDQLEGRNVVIEALRRRKRQVRKVFLDERSKSNSKITELLQLISDQNIKLERVDRQKLDKMSETGVHNGVIAVADALPAYTLKQLLDEIYAKDEFPFLVLADEIQYEQNLGAILRSAMGAGVHGVIVPKVRGKGISAVVQRVSMGGSEEVPLIREGLSHSIKILKKEGIPIVAADMDGRPVWDVNLKGALAVILGGESKGVSPTLRNKSDRIISVPLQNNLDSLNVSVTAGIIFFEKCRQERL